MFFRTFPSISTAYFPASTSNRNPRAGLTLRPASPAQTINAFLTLCKSRGLYRENGHGRGDSSSQIGQQQNQLPRHSAQRSLSRTTFEIQHPLFSFDLSHEVHVGCQKKSWKRH